MTETRKLSGAFKAALVTFALAGMVGFIGLANTARWYSSLPDYMATAQFPPSFYLGVGKLALQFLASAIGICFLLFGSGRSARLVSIAAIAILLLVHLSGWPAVHRAASESGSLLLAHGVRIAITVWLVFALARLVPNNSFKPKPLRGSA